MSIMSQYFRRVRKNIWDLHFLSLRHSQRYPVKIVVHYVALLSPRFSRSLTNFLIAAEAIRPTNTIFLTNHNTL